MMELSFDSVDIVSKFSLSVFFTLKKMTTLSLMTTFPDVPYGHRTEFSEKRVEKEQFLCIRIS